MPDSNSILGQTAAEVFIKSVVLFIVLLTFIWFSRSKSANERHFYLTLSTIILLMLPVSTLFFPSWGSGPIPNPFERISEQNALQLSNFEYSQLKASERTTKKSIQPINSPQTSAGLEYRSKNTKHVSEIVACVWLIGAASILIWLIGGKVASYVIYKKSKLFDDQNISETIQKICEKIGLKKHVLVMNTTQSKVPVVTGFIYPKLLLPSGIRGWPMKKMEAVLFHELAHIKRNDIFIQFLAQISCALYWFNPLSWIMERRMMIERERACDNIVLRQNIKPSAYATHLMETSEELGTGKNTNWVLAGMAEGTDFKDRVLSILDPNAKRTTLTSTRGLLTAIMIFLIFMPLITFNPWSTHAASLISHEDELFAQEVSKTTTQSSESKKQAPVPDEDKDNQRVQALILLLKDKDAKVRADAALALKDLDKRDVPGLINALKDEDAQVRANVALALKDLSDKRAVPGLINALKDEDAQVRANAALALKDLSDKGAVPGLINALKDEDAQVRANAAKALGDLDDKRAILGLINALKDEDAQVRANALKALEDIGWQDI